LLVRRTLSDCMDRQGRIIKGGKVLDPDLFNEPEMAYDIMKAMGKWKIKETSRFATTNRYAELRNDSNSKEKEQERDDDPESNDENDREERKIRFSLLLKNRTSTTQTTTRMI
jgi:hypothetical protein